MRVLVTGAAGFIGASLSHLLLERGNSVLGLDNMNSYYEVSLKKARLSRIANQKHFQFIIIHRENITISLIFYDQSE